MITGCGDIKISNLQIVTSIIKNSFIFSLEKFSEVELDTLIVKNIELIESTFIILIQKFTLTNFTFQDSKIINGLLITNGLLTNL